MNIVIHFSVLYPFDIQHAENFDFKIKQIPLLLLLLLLLLLYNIIIRARNYMHLKRQKYAHIYALKKPKICTKNNKICTKKFFLT
jgi:hypothetical protein